MARAARDSEAAQLLSYGHDVSWEQLPELRRQDWRDLIAAALTEAGEKWHRHDDGLVLRADLVRHARSLLDPVDEVMQRNRQYARGILELVGDATGRAGEEDRYEVADELGLSMERVYRLRRGEGKDDAEALDAIQHMLRDPQWGVAMLEDIAAQVRETGRSTENLPGDEPTWDRH
jgi:hypothetical protein